MLEGDLDPDFRELVSDELSSSRDEMEALKDEIRILLLPVDKDDDKNVIVEIRAGAGGEEAALFAASLYRMYTMYSDIRRWKTEVLNINETELGGIKEISFLIEGAGAYSRLKFESGVHRVQRVPDTESSGRIHTSTVTVAVLPEVEEVEVDINPADLQIDTFRSGGRRPTRQQDRVCYQGNPPAHGDRRQCQDERSQHKNRDRAVKILRSSFMRSSWRSRTPKLQQSEKARSGQATDLSAYAPTTSAGARYRPPHSCRCIR